MSLKKSEWLKCVKKVFHSVVKTDQTFFFPPKALSRKGEIHFQLEDSESKKSFAVAAGLGLPQGVEI